ncbi:MAG: glycosyltransferase family 39 protein [Planctomycetes bacterium]|nr:glycosyltransferase family 39 protein [Planctomycetota bacterium]
MTRRPLLWLALVCHVALATSYLLRTPCFEGPDENAHYQYAWHLANAGTLPVAPGHGAAPLDQAALAHHPPLYYALLATALDALGASDTVFSTVPNPAFRQPSALHWLHGGDERPPRARAHRTLAALRAVSVLLGLLSLLAVHRLARIACPDRPATADAAVLLVACLPMWSFVHGVLGNDTLATLVATATLALLARVWRDGALPWPRALGLGALLGAAACTKLTTAFLGLLALAALWRAGRRDRRAWGPALGALLVAAALGLPLLVRNLQLYGDPLAMNVHDAAFATIPAEYRWPWFWGGFLPQVFASLFGNFGWFALPPHPALLASGATGAGLALAGLLAHRVGPCRAALPQPLPLLLGACGLVFAGTAWFNLSAPQPQARLLFPAVGPAAVLLAAGLVHLGGLLRLGRHAWVLGLLPPAVAAWVAFGWFAPRFDPASAPADAHHATLVDGIVVATDAPAAGIEWRSPPPEAPCSAPPALRWHDAGAPADARYSLYAFDAGGRVWLASHEWFFPFGGDAVTLPGDAWAFLPTDRDVWLRLRRVPDWRAGERLDAMPVSAPLRIRRAPPH